MKYLFISLAIQDGEREYDFRCLHTTNAKNINFAAERYAATFWGESRLEKPWKVWSAFSGEINISLEKVKELTKEEYDFLHNLFYGS